MLVSICIAGGLLHSFTWADVVAAGILEVGSLVVNKLVVDFEEHAINGTNMATNAKNRRSNFGYFIVPLKNISLETGLIYHIIIFLHIKPMCIKS